MKPTAIRILLTGFPLALLLTLPSRALTPAEQAEAFYAKGLAAERANRPLTAEKCYQLALRVVSGHAGAQARLRELAARPKDPLEGVMLDRVQFSEASLSEVIGYLRRKFMEATAGRVPLRLLVNGDSGKSITLDLRNIRFTDALKNVCDAAGVACQRDGLNIVISPPGTRPPPLRKTEAAPSLPPAESLLSWTNTSGKTLKAAFSGMEGDAVILKSQEGKVFRFPLSSLNPAGQALARSLRDAGTGKKAE